MARLRCELGLACAELVHTIFGSGMRSEGARINEGLATGRELVCSKLGRAESYLRAKDGRCGCGVGFLSVKIRAREGTRFEGLAGKPFCSG